jgi:hypothetical protein
VHTRDVSLHLCVVDDEADCILYRKRSHTSGFQTVHTLYFEPSKTATLHCESSSQNVHERRHFLIDSKTPISTHSQLQPF